MVNELGKELAIIRIKTGDSLRTMASKLGISAAYLSSIENGKRNIPDDFSRMIFNAYDLNEDEMHKISDAIFGTKENYLVDLSRIPEKKRMVILALTEGNLGEETIDRLCEVINQDINIKKNAGRVVDVMRRENVITLDTTKDYLVYFSKKYEIDKKLSLTVPRGYVAIAYINGKAMYKASQCVEEKVISKCGKEFLGSQIQFAFYSPNLHPEFNYGFGPINVNNDRLKEAYRIGINGQMIIEIKDYIELINNFAFTDSITVEDVREKLLPIIKSVGTPIVSSCFVDTNVSVFEISSMIGEIRAKMLKSLENEKAFKEIGIAVSSVAINEIYVNEDDLEIIRKRINK